MSEIEQPKPLTERWLPQTSIRFFAAMIGVSALVMYTFRAAVVGEHLWAKCASTIIAIMIGSFIAYTMVFLVANIFSLATEAIVEAPLSHDSRSAKPGNSTPMEDR